MEKQNKRIKSAVRRVLVLALLIVLLYAALKIVQDTQPAEAPAETAAALTLLTDPPQTGAPPDTQAAEVPAEDGSYTDVENVACYLHTYGHLPDNYITKAEAEDAGWISTEGNLWDVSYGSSIGGDRFYNSDGLLPKGEKYYEADVNYDGGYRGSERIVYTEDGSVWYTSDHYDSFEQLY